MSGVEQLLQPDQTAVALQRVTSQHQPQHTAAAVATVVVVVVVAGRGHGEEVRPRILQRAQVVVAQV